MNLSKLKADRLPPNIIDFIQLIDSVLIRRTTHKIIFGSDDCEPVMLYDINTKLLYCYGKEIYYDGMLEFISEKFNIIIDGVSSDLFQYYLKTLPK